MKKSLVLIGLLIVGYFLFSNGAAAVGKQPYENGGQPGAAETATSTFVETRCGWFSNPTPGNAWLTDKDAEWIVGAQGGHQSEGDWPAFKDSQWIKTNGSYGYGCACLKGTFNSKDHEVIKIQSATVRPLSACKKDKALKKPQD